MKCKILYIVAILAIAFSSCTKDLGNYEYNPPATPKVEGIKDSTFEAFVGDSLVINPNVLLGDGDPGKDLSFEWEIQIIEELRAAEFKGRSLRMLFNLRPIVYSAKLTVIDNRNGMKYFLPFKIQGKTAFAQGTVVLSNHDGVTKLSFVKPDNTVLSNLYGNLYGEALPANAVQLFVKPKAYQPETEDYWVMCKDNSVILDANTMLRKRYFPEQFLTPPSSLTAGYLEPLFSGVAMGVINGKLYIGITTTAPFAPDYGKFANAQAGDYNLSPFFTYHPNNFYFGFDKQKKAFVWFKGNGSFAGTDYVVNGNNAFDPKNTYNDLLYMKGEPFGPSYAFFRDANGVVQELGFTLALNNESAVKTITVNSKRTFAASALINADSKWQVSPVGVFYFTSNDKIYRYNPINEEVKALQADFGGKKVSMLKLSADGNSLITGVNGAVYTLDVSTGNNGPIIKTINGIPGEPVDVFIRK